MSHTTDAIDKLFLELSQFTRATTGKEIYMETVISKQQDTIQQLERQNAELVEALHARLNAYLANDPVPYDAMVVIRGMKEILDKHKEAP